MASSTDLQASSTWTIFLRKGVPLSAPFAVARGVSRQLLINLFDALAVLSHGFPFRHQSLSSRIKSASGP